MVPVDAVVVAVIVVRVRTALTRAPTDPVSPCA
jgi:hypothetical protein